MILKHSLMRKAVLNQIIQIKKIDKMAFSNYERFGRTKKKKKRRVLLWSNIKMTPIFKKPSFTHVSR